MDQSLKRAILLDHYEKPHNHGLSEDESYQQKHTASSSCIDDLTVQMSVKDGIIEDIRFDGHACTISTASTSIFSDLLKGKSLEEAEKILDAYYAMLKNKPYDEDLLEEANAFDTLYAQPNRIKCGTIGIDAMRELIEKSKTNA